MLCCLCVFLCLVCADLVFVFGYLSYIEMLMENAITMYYVCNDMCNMYIDVFHLYITVLCVCCLVHCHGLCVC